MFKKVILLLLVLFCFGTIFILSGQEAKVSNGLSSDISKKALEAVTDYSGLPENEQGVMLMKWNNYFRDWAHFGLFMLLGIFLSQFLKILKVNNFLFITFGIAFCYALFDELRQELFIEGRGFQMADLYKDWAGSMVGIILGRLWR